MFLLCRIAALVVIFDEDKSSQTYSKSSLESTRSASLELLLLRNSGVADELRKALTKLEAVAVCSDRRGPGMYSTVLHSLLPVSECWSLVNFF